MKKQIYFNGDIITMENFPAEALLTESGKISALGGREHIFSLRDEDTELIDLEGRTLMPSFIDSHSHIVSCASTISLISLRETSSFSEISDRIKNFIELKKPAPGQWVTGFGYDNNFLEEKSHPTRRFLDKLCPDNPLLITHASGHMGAANSYALKLMGITSETPDPEGGKIGREPGSLEPDGYLEETAFTRLTSVIPAPTPEIMCRQLQEAQDMYLGFGITTVQEGLTGQSEWDLLKAMSNKAQLKTDIVCYIDLNKSKSILYSNKDFLKYRNHLRIGGYKIFLDGSPQGKTAWLTKPYEESGDYKGYPIYSDKSAEAFVTDAVSENIQLLAHCNGDAAADQFIEACFAAAAKYPELPGLRPVMIHAQLVRKDQLEKMKDINMISSFFPAHIYYWGDVHLKNLGFERGSNISPVKSAIDNGIIYTFHQDTPVLPPDMLETIWCVVNRETKKGTKIGQSQCISVYEALKGITINAAYQYFEEDKKGSLRPGKLADMVILSDNPLKTDPSKLRNIQITETIKDGKTLFKI